MANFDVTLSIRDTNKLVRDFNKRSQKARKIASLNTISSARASLSKLIIPEIIKSVRESKVFRGIMGDFAGKESGLDLQAEFGLTNADSSSFESELMSSLQTGSSIIIERATTFQNTKNATKSRLKINPYNPTYDDKIKSFSSGSHKSRVDDTGETINWLEWTLDNSHDVDSDYRITYRVGSFSELFSRSKRAIMIKGSGYDLPIQLKPTVGRNWIEEAIIKKNPQIVRAIDATLRKTLKQNLTKALRSQGFK